VDNSFLGPQTNKKALFLGLFVLQRFYLDFIPVVVHYRHTRKNFLDYKKDLIIKSRYEIYMKNILRRLVKQEQLEREFISFYEMFKEEEFIARFPEEKREEFLKIINTLSGDSCRHYELVRDIINKYDQAKLFAAQRNLIV